MADAAQSDGDLIVASDTEGNGVGDIVFKTGQVERGRIRADGSGTGVFGGSLPAAKYRIITDGTNVYAYDQTGAAVYSGSDAGAAVTACLPAVGAAGATIEFRNDGSVFPWSTVPALPSGITNKLLIRGNGSTVRLSSAAPRFLDPHRTADNQTFQNIEIVDLVIDCNSVGGRHHIVFGYWISGSWGFRVNYDRCAVRRIKVVNAPVGTDSSVDFRIGVAFATSNNLADTQNTITNILVEDYDQSGGLMGVDVGGHPSSDTTCNVYVDNVTVDKWRVERSSRPSAFISGGADVIVGDKGTGGKVVISRGVGTNSPDVGIEIDAMQDATVRDVTIYNAYNHNFYGRNYAAAGNIDEQVHRYDNCTSIVDSGASSGQGWNYQKSGSPFSQYPPSAVLANCAHHDDSGLQTDFAGYDFEGCPRVVARDCRLVVNLGSQSVATSVLLRGSRWNSFDTSFTSTFTTDANVKIRGFRAKITGTKSGIGTLTYLPLLVGDTGFTAFDIDEALLDFVVTSIAFRGIEIGSTGGTPTVRGTITRPRFFTNGASSGACIQIDGSANTTINGRVTILEPDFSRAQAALAQVTFQGTSNAAKVETIRANWNTAPAAAAITPGSSPYDYQNADGYPERVVVAAGTVSKVELSIDGAAYTDLGVIAGAFRLNAGDHLRVTYTVAPTMTKVPEV